jgi:hypothetical protein
MIINRWVDFSPKNKKITTLHFVALGETCTCSGWSLKLVRLMVSTLFSSPSFSLQANSCTKRAMAVHEMLVACIAPEQTLFPPPNAMVLNKSTLLKLPSRNLSGLHCSGSILPVLLVHVTPIQVDEHLAP